MIKDIGFVSVISKEEAGSDYERRLAQDLYKVCETALFPKYGGMVSMLDLFYIYNKTRQTCLISPEELLAVCARFEQFGLKAKLTNYTGNIKIVESTSFDPDKDYELNYSRFFPDYSTGFTAEEVARRKGWPVVIVEINLNRAARQGKLAKADLIEGVKYYKNLFVALK